VNVAAAARRENYGCKGKGVAEAVLSNKTEERSLRPEGPGPWGPLPKREEKTPTRREARMEFRTMLLVANQERKRWGPVVIPIMGMIQSRKER